MKEQIELAIQSALRRESKLTPEAMEPGGFTSPEIRHLMNNLASFSTSYLECGTHRGSLSVASIFGNNLKATLCDNWSEFNESDAREDFLRFHKKFMPEAWVIEQDCFTITKDQVNGNPDLYLFDAEHSYEAQQKAITYFEEFFADHVIICVDDFNWEQVERGTRMGLGYLTLSGKWKLVHEWILSGPEWWNGYSLFLLKK